MPIQEYTPDHITSFKSLDSLKILGGVFVCVCVCVCECVRKRETETETERENEYYVTHVDIISDNFKMNVFLALETFLTFKSLLCHSATYKLLIDQVI
jgi:hypothetical protein